MVMLRELDNENAIIVKIKVISQERKLETMIGIFYHIC